MIGTDRAGNLISDCVCVCVCVFLVKEEEGEGARRTLNPAIIKTNSTFPAPAHLLICV